MDNIKFFDTCKLVGLLTVFIVVTVVCQITLQVGNLNVLFASLVLVLVLAC